MVFSVKYFLLGCINVMWVINTQTIGNKSSTEPGKEHVTTESAVTGSNKEIINVQDNGIEPSTHKSELGQYTDCVKRYGFGVFSLDSRCSECYCDLSGIKCSMTNGCDHSQVNEVVEKPVEGIHQFYRCIAIYGVKKFEDIQNKRECVCTPEGRVCYPVDDTPSGPEDENSILENPKIEGLMEKYKMCVLQSGNNFFHGGDRCSLCLCTFGGRKCLDVSCELLEEIDLDRDVHKKKGTVLESNTSTLRTHIYT